MSGTHDLDGTQAARESIEADLAEIDRLLAHVRDQLAELPTPEPAPPAEPELLTVGETAEALRISPSFVKKLIRDGEITVERFGRRVLVPIESVESYRETRRVS